MLKDNGDQYSFTAQVKWSVLKLSYETSLAVQWIRICLPMQETQVWSLIREDPTYCRGTNRIHHSYSACTLDPGTTAGEPMGPGSGSCNRCSPSLKPVLCNKGSHHSERPARCSGEWCPLSTARESSSRVAKTQHSQKKKKNTTQLPYPITTTWLEI